LPRLDCFVELNAAAFPGVFAVKDGKETLLRDGTAHDHGDA
jgi:hypothetical protein